MPDAEIIIIEGPQKPLRDDQKNRLLHALALRILNPTGEPGTACLYGVRWPKWRARITLEFWVTHKPVLRSAGFKITWPTNKEES